MRSRPQSWRTANRRRPSRWRSASLAMRSDLTNLLDDDVMAVHDHRLFFSRPCCINGYYLSLSSRSQRRRDPITDPSLSRHLGRTVLLFLTACEHASLLCPCTIRSLCTPLGTHRGTPLGHNLATRVWLRVILDVRSALLRSVLVSISMRPWTLHK